jgi:hypothetical protein
MRAGVEVFNESGALRLSITDRITRYIGTQFTGSNDGAIVAPALSLGTPWFLVTPNGSGSNTGRVEPSVSITGTTLSWSFGGLPVNMRMPIYISYGVY